MTTKEVAQGRGALMLVVIHVNAPGDWGWSRAYAKKKNAMGRTQSFSGPRMRRESRLSAVQARVARARLMPGPRPLPAHPASSVSDADTAMAKVRAVFSQCRSGGVMIGEHQVRLLMLAMAIPSGMTRMCEMAIEMLPAALGSSITRFGTRVMISGTTSVADAYRRHGRVLQIKKLSTAAVGDFVDALAHPLALLGLGPGPYLLDG